MAPMPNLPENWAGYLAVILGSLMGLFKIWIPARRRSFESVTDRQNQYADRLEKENEKLLERVEKEEEESGRLKSENERLRASVMFIQSSQMDIPLPLWIKDMDGIMISCNKAYEDKFLRPMGITAADYIGRPDWEIWGKEFAKKIEAHERKVIATRAELRGQDVVGAGDGRKVITKWIKYPLFNNGVMIGHAGMITEISDG